MVLNRGSCFHSHFIASEPYFKIILMHRINVLSFIVGLLLLWGTFDLFGYACNNISLRVWQVPHLHVTQGQNASITCHFSVPNNSESITILWKKDNERIYFKKLVVQLGNASNASNVLQLQFLSQNQSGLYKCEVSVEVPKLWSGCGTGTNVSVTAGRPEGQEPTGLVIAPEWILAFGVAFLLIIFVISALVFRRRKKDTQTSENRAENTQQIILQESSQNTEEITYASINKQMFSFRESQQRHPKQDNVKSQTQEQGVEETVLYSAIRTKQVD